MYNPSRGGVRGGTDQFSWDTVKTDKHRENYLGHSVMAPVGRWQKGKDLSWYAKERKNEGEASNKSNEMASIKKAEEEAMLVALGFKPAKKVEQSIPKEELNEVLKRGNDERSSLNIERVGGVGVGSGRASMQVNNSKLKSKEGISFETHSTPRNHVQKSNDSSITKSSKSESVSRPSKKSKKMKKDKKHNKKKKKKEKIIDSSHSDNDSNSDDMKISSRNISNKRHGNPDRKDSEKRYRNDKTSSNDRHCKRHHAHNSSSDDEVRSSKVRTRKEYKHDVTDFDKRKKSKRRHDSEEFSLSKHHRDKKDSWNKHTSETKRIRRHDTSESD